VHVFEPRFTPTTLEVDALVGQYTLCEDGWVGGLRLAATGPSTLSGQYISYRFGTRHAVSAHLTADGPKQVHFDIHDFNGLPAQHFTGYPGADARRLIAGATDWRDERYGFYARRGVPRPLPAFRTGDALPADFAGVFVLRCGAAAINVELAHEDERRLAGHWRYRDAEPMQVAGEVDHDDPLLVRLVFRTQGADAAFTGYLFSRPKNVVAGWIDTPEARHGCYLVRTG
jgi:hypothetical protein